MIVQPAGRSIVHRPTHLLDCELLCHTTVFRTLLCVTTLPQTEKKAAFTAQAWDTSGREQ